MAWHGVPCPRKPHEETESWGGMQASGGTCRRVVGIPSHASQELSLRCGCCQAAATLHHLVSLGPHWGLGGPKRSALWGHWPLDTVLGHVGC